MFFAKILKPGESAEIDCNEECGDVLHISQACLHKPVDDTRNYLKILQEKDSVAACVLQKDKTEFCSLDIFLTLHDGKSIKLKNEGGKNDIHITGYFEPMPESDIEESGSERCNESESESENGDICGKVEDLDAEESDDEAAQKSGKKLKDIVSGVSVKKAMLKCAMKEGQRNGKKDVNSLKDDQAEEDEGSDEDTSDDENEAHEDDESQENGSDDEEQSDENDGEENDEEEDAAKNKKRKAQHGDAASGSKKAKGSIDDGAYLKELISYLKMNGKTPLASLGQKVKKPAGVDIKMAQFLKSKADIFNIEDGFATLKK